MTQINGAPAPEVVEWTNTMRTALQEGAATDNLGAMAELHGYAWEATMAVVEDGPNYAALWPDALQAWDHIARVIAPLPQGYHAFPEFYDAKVLLQYKHIVPVWAADAVPSPEQVGDLYKGLAGVLGEVTDERCFSVVQAETGAQQRGLLVASLIARLQDPIHLPWPIPARSQTQAKHNRPNLAVTTENGPIAIRIGFATGEAPRLPNTNLPFFNLGALAVQSENETHTGSPKNFAAAQLRWPEAVRHAALCVRAEGQHQGLPPQEDHYLTHLGESILELVTNY